ncbi:uncharacterized protein KY384_009086 [Bacidia gigantensis]|uniref:uncharacterized protein n=1 Tax=Bacidia gigantensis TaxID=2732470 RepID=UPI001D046910|nr:uncharacterized protein KY384_009086 [Bacidia gigantensis]KAG8525442.1 hypothetical protein KY384_009086 [Bacidia gigantensis]
MASLKGPGEARSYDGSGIRIAIVHARWNTQIITALVNGARKALLESGVKEENIVVQDVPGSFELPYAVHKTYESSKVQAANVPTISASAVTDLLSAAPLSDLSTPQPTAASQQDPPKSSLSAPSKPLQTPFNAIIAIGVLIKGETMHFEYIADATSHGLMRVQSELGVPVIFGLLTVLNEEQAKARAGLSSGSHCHGEDWGKAAVELAMKKAAWAEGKFIPKT